MGLKDLAAEDVANVFLNGDDYGEDATYTPGSGSPSNITVIAQRHPVIDKDVGDDGRAEVYTATIYVDVADVAMPTRGDRISTTGPDGETEDWGVDEKYVAVGVWMLECYIVDERQVIGGGSRREI